MSVHQAWSLSHFAWMGAGKLHKSRADAVSGDAGVALSGSPPPPSRTSARSGASPFLQLAPPPIVEEAAFRCQRPAALRHGACADVRRGAHSLAHPNGVQLNKIVSILLLVAGVVVLIVGINSSNSFSSETSEVFTGSPTDNAMWLMIGGGAMTLVGLAGLSGVLGGRRTA